jgi:dTDP-4-dehydrorhamnose 3,5-epimerase
MKFINTELEDTYIIEPEKITDNRGFFARSFCVKEFAKSGIEFHIEQCSMSFNKNKGTLRGLHYQCAPHEEAKVVRCTKGSIYDVVADLRPESSSYKKWMSIELNEKNNKAIYIPAGCAHGFQTLLENTVVYYQMNEFYHPECARGIRYDDPSFGIEWPINKITISDKDSNYRLI